MSAPQSGAPTQGSAMVECPWLTRGTAAAVLGGDEFLAVSIESHAEGSCMFHNQQKPPEALAITVSSTVPRTCREKSVNLAGIANWASLCSVSRSHHRHIESVSGQVRNTYFTVALSFRQETKWRARDTDIEQIAEIVAGNLY
ncbi:MAG: hypothetical protein WCF17_14615 [Terracidiphilus sp.]